MLLLLPLTRNPLAFCPISPSLSSWTFGKCFLCLYSPLCFWTHSKQGSVSTPPTNCPHQSHRCPRDCYTHWATFLVLILLTDQQLLKIITSSVWQGFVHVTLRTRRLAWFSGCLTGHDFAGSLRHFCWFLLISQLLNTGLPMTQSWGRFSFLSTLLAWFCHPYILSMENSHIYITRLDSYMNSRAIYATVYIGI